MLERQIGAVISVFTLTIYWVTRFLVYLVWAEPIPAVIAWHHVPWLFCHTRRAKGVGLSHSKKLTQSFILIIFCWTTLQASDSLQLRGFRSIC